jgi:hypothetical protein
VKKSLSHMRACWELLNWIIGREISYRAGRRGRDGSPGQEQGRQGRGSWDNKPKTYTASSKAPEMKFILHGIGKEVWQTATYQTVKDYICTMPKRQAVVIFPEVNYELCLVMENVKRESWRRSTSSPKIGLLVLIMHPARSPNTGSWSGS